MPTEKNISLIIKVFASGTRAAELKFPVLQTKKVQNTVGVGLMAGWYPSGF